jgi:hypothetical protein
VPKIPTSAVEAGISTTTGPSFRFQNVKTYGVVLFGVAICHFQFCSLE